MMGPQTEKRSLLQRLLPPARTRGLPQALELHPLRYALTPVRGRLEDLGLTPGMRVLELGCGQGFLIPGILQTLGPTGHYTGLDPDSSALDVAKATHSGDTRVTLLPQGWPSTLPDGPFDHILLHHVFHQVKDRGGLIRELRLRLTSQGTLGLWEATLLVPEWRIRSWEGMFLGQDFRLEARISSPLGSGRRFRAD